MPTFAVKQLTVPLFGVVEVADQAVWWNAFATQGTTVPIDVDSAALDIIADELELDVEGLADDARRYVSGQYRAKARGMGGSTLGNIGEILTFLANRVPGRQIVRVVSSRPGAGQPVKGSRFPQPDFIVRDGSGLAALEVKSTQAFNFIDLRDATNNWRWLQPCSSVAKCRAAALPQLAYQRGVQIQQRHSLAVRSGSIVPFPVGKGIATAVLAVDGRANTLRSDGRFRTRKDCRQASRSCWSCVPSGCNFILVTMPNAPGMLSLAGAEGYDAAASWFRAYQRWSQALTTRDAFAVREALSVLSDSLTGWLATPGLPRSEALRAFWGSYLHDVLRSRGFAVEIPGQFGDLNLPSLGIEWSPAPLADPAVREGTIEEIARFIRNGSDDLAPFIISARLESDGHANESVSVESSGDFVDFRLVSEIWWTSGSVENNERAATLAARLLSVALETSGFPAAVGPLELNLREVVAKVGEYEVQLGWVSAGPMLGIVSNAQWRRLWHWYFDPAGRWPHWPLALALADPRVRLRVLSDGRADLRIDKALLNPL